MYAAVGQPLREQLPGPLGPSAGLLTHFPEEVGELLVVGSPNIFGVPFVPPGVF